MRIYYFGELVEDTNKKEQIIEQTALKLEQPEKTVKERIDELLQDIDLSIDVYKPFNLQKQG